MAKQVKPNKFVNSLNQAVEELKVHDPTSGDWYFNSSYSVYFRYIKEKDEYLNLYIKDGICTRLIEFHISGGNKFPPSVKMSSEDSKKLEDILQQILHNTSDCELVMTSSAKKYSIRYCKETLKINNQTTK